MLKFDFGIQYYVWNIVFESKSLNLRSLTKENCAKVCPLVASSLIVSFSVFCHWTKTAGQFNATAPRTMVCSVRQRSSNPPPPSGSIFQQFRPYKWLTAVFSSVRLSKHGSVSSSHSEYLSPRKSGTFNSKWSLIHDCYYTVFILTRLAVVGYAAWLFMDHNLLFALKCSYKHLFHTDRHRYNWIGSNGYSTQVISHFEQSVTIFRNNIWAFTSRIWEHWICSSLRHFRECSFGMSRKRFRIFRAENSCFVARSSSNHKPKPWDDNRVNSLWPTSAWTNDIMTTKKQYYKYNVFEDILFLDF